jgi:methanogenic corrinoid protein MtbC1
VNNVIYYFKEVMEIQEEILVAIQTANLNYATELIKKWGESHGFEHFTEKILLPVLEKYTLDDFKFDGSPLAQGYVAARFAEIAMNMTMEHSLEHELSGLYKGPIVIGNIEDDFHSLGRRIICAFLKSNGWIIYDIGNDVPADEFVEKALETNSKIIAVSAMMYSTAINISRIREALIRRNLENSIKLAVGGAIFNLRSDLMMEVGGDGTAKSALQVPKLFESLLSN